ncbi:helix-turn-helix transcriptional regulator [Rhodococcus phenolicus]|uniref:helix-turn-helix transcriptional regulator n=1 Tax=Rhodococcus phenolicus TaxID=263849 RepID=UPI00082EC1D6|nr:hypothetical protein [Rhodococcus phenolicus]
MTRRYLSLRDIAAEYDLALNTLKSMELRGKFPAPDVIVGRGEGRQITKGWSETTVQAWWNGYAAEKSPGGTD